MLESAIRVLLEEQRAVFALTEDCAVLAGS